MIEKILRSEKILLSHKFKASQLFNTCRRCKGQKEDHMKAVRRGSYVRTRGKAE